jgi:hypothetical protein
MHGLYRALLPGAPTALELSIEDRLNRFVLNGKVPYIFFSFAFSASSFFKRFRYCLFAMIGGGLPKWQDWFGYRRPTFDIRIGLRIQQQLINISS